MCFDWWLLTWLFLIFILKKMNQFQVILKEIHEPVDWKEILKEKTVDFDVHLQTWLDDDFEKKAFICIGPDVVHPMILEILALQQTLFILFYLYLDLANQSEFSIVQLGRGPVTWRKYLRSNCGLVRRSVVDFKYSFNNKLD
jgi:hypothetical protein